MKCNVGQGTDFFTITSKYSTWDTVRIIASTHSTFYPPLSPPHRKKIGIYRATSNRSDIKVVLNGS